MSEVLIGERGLDTPLPIDFVQNCSENGVLGALDGLDTLDSGECLFELASSRFVGVVDDECDDDLLESECNRCDLGVCIVVLDCCGEDLGDLCDNALEIDFGALGEELVDCVDLSH